MQGGFTDERQVQASKATTNISNLNATHEEADTRMVLHCIHNSSETIVVSARDTDVLLLLVAHCDHVQSNNLWLMAGAAKIRKYFNISKIYDTLSENTVPALLPYHSLTGCDTTSYFFGKSKKATRCKFQQHYNLLATLGEGELTDLKLHDAEKLVCRMSILIRLTPQMKCVLHCSLRQANLNTCPQQVMHYASI